MLIAILVRVNTARRRSVGDAGQWLPRHTPSETGCLSWDKDITPESSLNHSFWLLNVKKTWWCCQCEVRLRDSSSSSSSSRNEYYLGGIITLLPLDHRTMSTKSVCSSQYMVTDQHWATGAQINAQTGMGLVNSASWNTLPVHLCLWTASENIWRLHVLYYVFCSVGIVATGAFVTILVNYCVSEMTVYYYYYFHV